MSNIPDAVKGTGFYTPMDIAPNEHDDTVDKLPRGKMEQYYFGIDVDGTLRDKIVDQNIAPIANEDIRNLLIILKRSFKNVRIIVWSGSGEMYARQVGASFGLNSYVSHYMDKRNYVEFSKGRNIIAIDDMQATKLGNVANLIVR